ncbi:unnamed protein product [Closterium sp. NIES-65]|nr:unnamed protein product [Closterium sp. NIES-65]
MSDFGTHRFHSRVTRTKIEILSASKPPGADSVNEALHTAVRVCSCRNFPSRARRVAISSLRLHFPLPSPPLPPLVASTSPSRRLHFPLPPPPLPPPFASTSPSCRLHFPLPSPPLPPPLAFTSPSPRLHFPRPSTSLPSPIARAPPSHPPARSPVALSSPAHPVSPAPSLPSVPLCLSPLLILFPLSPPIPHPLFLKFRWCTRAIGECGAAASLAPLPRCSSPSPPALRQPRLDCPLPPPVHPSLTTLHLSHCPPLTIGFPLPSSSSSHSSSSSSPLARIVLSGASIAPPSSLFPPHLLASSLTTTSASRAAPRFLLLRTAPASTALHSSSTPSHPALRRSIPPLPPSFPPLSLALFLTIILPFPDANPPFP